MAFLRHVACWDSRLFCLPSPANPVRINVVGPLGPALMSCSLTPDVPHNFLFFPRYLVYFSRTICVTRPLYAFPVLVSAMANSVPPPTPGPQPRGEGRPFPRELYPACSTEY